MNIAIFVSGSGTNCENLIKYFTDHERIHPALVVSNKPDAYALVRAERLGVPTAVTPKADLHNPDVMLPLLRKYDIGFIVLAGWLPLIPDFLIEAYPHKMINIHPALLPKYGGKGMWGHHVHEGSPLPRRHRRRHRREGAPTGNAALPESHRRNPLIAEAPSPVGEGAFVIKAVTLHTLSRHRNRDSRGRG